MNVMIKKLLQGQAVEWRTLGEVVLPTNNIKWHESDLSYRYIDLSSVDKDNNNIGETLEITSKNAPSRAQKIVKKDDIIFATTRPTQMRSALIPPNLDGQIASTGYCILRANQNEVLPKWIYYNLQINEFKIYLQDKQSGTAYPAISDGLIKQFQIPIPPLSVQSQIVQILDAFTELTAELTAELSMRQKQYQYYRDLLLSEHELAKVGFEWKTLGEVGEVRMCKRILKSQTSDTGDIPFYKIGTFGKEPNAFISRELFEKYREKYNYPKMGEILISASGTIGRTVIFNGEDAYFQDSNIVWIENDEKQVLNKFLFYLYQIADWNIAEGGTIKRLYNDNLKNLQIPIPPLDTQAKIVAILDAFDTLTQSISEGLPKEIQLRQKQYEYYRELLLGFDN
ncbi:Type I restriction-modification system, specificity subunit S [Moraxella catarrhalis]|uniref:Type I restriction-modification system, specificity subunit S n=1 Tax=Moraxella catarrhalis TaxID=480 RepID=A0AB36DMS5_MORCA|nr:restriction endonuclease subunit S [Moraxella catarrhalis]OAV24510.1 Type I restriction-modification system, specificity subunit S [Moraxella catarrhalis]OAV30879.1 Type I restriction-modification system, specificity subunit S [Moraxella catarrhalis]